MTLSDHSPTRRRFLGGVAATGGAAALGLAGCGGSDSSDPAASAADSGAGTGPAAAPAASSQVSAADLAGRTLIVIELEGGADGLDLVVPRTGGAYRDLRPDIGLDLATLLPLDSEVGLHPNLTGLHTRGVATIEGVGMPEPDLSHFESSRRWWQGDMTGQATLSTGFLGRCCDVLRGDEPVTGATIGRATSPSLRSANAVTLSVPDPDSGGWLSSDDEWIHHARTGLTTMAGSGASVTSSGTPLVDLSRRNLTRALDFLQVLEDLPENDQEQYPGTDIGRLLSICGRLLGADAGVRVLHVPWGSFDTHDDHRGSFDYQMMELDEAITALLTDLDDRGLADQTLIATTSEFGRRPAQNAGGTDHGTANTMLLAGPVTTGRHGEAASLTDLDDEDNLVATVTVDEYYATLAESWLGVPATEVLGNGAKPIPGIFT